MSSSDATKGELSRGEIVEIIERNVQLYHQEPSFAKYIAELAFYLIEHQYEGRALAAQEANQRSGNRTQIEAEGGRVVYALYSTFQASHRKRYCPFCGAKTNGEPKCPTCKLPVH